MTTHYKTRGFVFKKSDVNESDRNFSVFTEDYGRLDIYAKAIRKSVSKLRSGMDSFFISDIEFIQGKKRKTLTDAQAVEKFCNLPQTPQKFRLANAMASLLDDFIKGQQKDRDIFNLINETFFELNNYALDSKPYTLIYYYFLWNFLSLLGYGPQVEKCAHCSVKLDPYNLYFSNKSGGVICKKCLNHNEQAVKINSDAVKLIRLILKKDWQIIFKLKIEPACQNLFQEISNNYCSYNSLKNN